MNIIFNYTDIKNCTAKCKLCERVIKTSGNSINLTSHLKNKNSDVFAKCAQKKVRFCAHIILEFDNSRVNPCGS